MAALTPICGIEPQPEWVSNIGGQYDRVYVRSSLRLDSFNESCGMNGGFDLLVLVD